MVEGQGQRVSGLGFGVSGFGFQVQGVGTLDPTPYGGRKRQGEGERGREREEGRDGGREWGVGPAARQSRVWRESVRVCGECV